ncbi:bile acid:sodium symporter family protein [Leptodesmis sichuanensis]|uniref:bile acid:sodium symporter family protein n=1 Tax=Leptodesmis sichuanensis TaxID=2906798 RepID=UPI001F23A12A|nr:bile acid:sodium symporter [Leptodesmis sichuanensis]UIE39066.1 bile acid:sodium symporter [Leptodesmis sichuanensis A121]
MKEAIQVLADLSTLVFVVSSMLSLGLSLTLPQILNPLKDVGFVLRVLLANFVLVPLVAYLLTRIIPLDPSLSIGLILLATVAGAPFLPKLAEISKGNIPLSVGLMVLLMVVTVFYAPIVLPLLLPGVQVNPLEIARSLIILMLIPLAIGLFIHARYESIAESLQPYMAQASSTTLLMVFVLMLVLNIQSVVNTVGSGALLAALLLIAASLGIGYVLGGQLRDAKLVSALGTAQRNVAAAMVVATGNFSNDPKVLTMILIGLLLMLVILMPLAGEIGRRATR